MDTPRLIAHLSIGIALGLLLAVVSQRFPQGLIPGDAFTYLAAGERLNAGHQLYALSPGDRPVAPEPPYWTVPLLSPPPIAVLWRPLAALPSTIGVYVWWALHVTSVLAAFVLVAARRPVLASLALIVLVLPFAYELSVANLNGFVLLGLILTWRAFATGDSRGAGVLAGALAAFKITPAMLGWWLLSRRQWSALRWAVGAGLVILAVSLLGAGLTAHVDYLSIMGRTAVSGARPLSLGGLATALGVVPDVARWLPLAAVVIGVVAVGLLRKHADLGFIAAVVTMVIGSPTVSISWFALLFATLAPFAWPARGFGATVGGPVGPSATAPSP